MVEDQKISLDKESSGPSKILAEVGIDVKKEKSQNLPRRQNFDESKELDIVQNVKLADASKEERLSFRQSEKSKAESKAEKNLSDILAWENNKKSAVEAQLKKIEEKIEKKKARYVEKMRNKVAAMHKEAEERRAKIDAKRREEILKTRIKGAKCRHTGFIPDATCGCFQDFSAAKCAKRSLFSLKMCALLS